MTAQSKNKRFMPRTSADYELLNCWIDSGKNDGQILKLVETSGWRSDVIPLDDGTRVCAHCHRQISLQSCSACGQTIQDECPIVAQDLYRIAYFLLVQKKCNPRAVPSLLIELNSYRGNLLTREEILALTHSAATEVCRACK